MFHINFTSITHPCGYVMIHQKRDFPIFSCESVTLPRTATAGILPATAWSCRRCRWRWGPGTWPLPRIAVLAGKGGPGTCSVPLWQQPAGSWGASLPRPLYWSPWEPETAPLSHITWCSSISKGSSVPKRTLQDVHGHGPQPEPFIMSKSRLGHALELAEFDFSNA